VVGAISAMFFSFSRILSSIITPSTFFKVGILFKTKTFRVFLLVFVD
jgi:hypothetical protein